MTKIQQIMTANPICLSQHSDVHKARMLMAEKSIRHIPVKDIEKNQLVGLVSQKTLLANAIKIINQRGLEQLEHEEKSLSLADIMNQEPLTCDINTSLLDAAQLLLSRKGGCVVVLENGKISGVITSNDFVKLTVKQLSE